MKKYAFFILAVLLMLGAYTEASADMNNGARLFKKHCARCHGDDGTVSTYGKSIKPYPARDLRTNRLFIAPAELLTTIKYGLYGREMKGWEDTLSDREIVDVARFVRTLKYEPNLESGKKFFKARCGSCHSNKGAVKKLFKAPDLDMSPLGAIAMARVVRLGRHGTMMNPKRDLFRNADIANVVAYLQSIKK